MMQVKKLKYVCPQSEELVLMAESFVCESSQMSTEMETLLEGTPYEWII